MLQARAGRTVCLARQPRTEGTGQQQLLGQAHKRNCSSTYSLYHARHGLIQSRVQSRDSSRCRAAVAVQPEPQETWKDRFAWITLCATVFIYMSGVSMLSPVLPSIVLHFGASTKVMGGIMSSFAVAMCASLQLAKPPTSRPIDTINAPSYVDPLTKALCRSIGSLFTGRASDKLGPRLLIVSCLFGTGSAMLLSACAWNITAFIMFRCAQTPSARHIVPRTRTTQHTAHSTPPHAAPQHPRTPRPHSARTGASCGGKGGGMQASPKLVETFHSIPGRCTPQATRMITSRASAPTS